MHYLHKVMRISLPVNRRQFLKASAGLATLPSTTSFAAPVKLRVAAASDLKFALTALANSFTTVTGIEIDLQFGSSGNFAQQIQQGCTEATHGAAQSRPPSAKALFDYLQTPAAKEVFKLAHFQVQICL